MHILKIISSEHNRYSRINETEFFNNILYSDINSVRTRFIKIIKFRREIFV